MYLGIIFLVDGPTSQTFTLSRPLDTLDKKAAYDLLVSEAQADPDSVATILIVEGKYDDQGDMSYPQVIKHWTGENGDFEDC